ncbi:unnamed protein product, partial [Leptidea sinapis]
HYKSSRVSHLQRNNFHPKSYYSANNQVNDEFWCETCDKGFNTKKMLEGHQARHQKCNIDGCQFVAHPNIITKHIQMQHSTGLYKKIANLNNPEEIKKWREERKKKYPTLKNVEKKNAEIKEKIERGEKMGLNVLKGRSGNFAARKRPFETNRQGHKRVRKHTEYIDKNDILKRKPYQKKICVITPVIEGSGLKPFSGITQLLPPFKEDDKEEASNDLIEDDEYINIAEEEEMVQTEKDQPTVCGALASLINNYDSSDDEEKDKSNNSIKTNITESFVKCDTNKKDIVTDKKVLKPLIIDNNIKNDISVEDDSGPEEISICREVTKCNNSEKVDSVKSNTKLIKLQSNKKIIKEKFVKSNEKVIYKRKIPSTLLQKLLCNEIRQERNMILQCVRFVVKNNFFENSQP